VLGHPVSERAERSIPGLHEPLLEAGESLWGERVEVASADTAMLDQSGAFQYPKMLAHRRASHREDGGQLTDWHRAVAQSLDDLATSTVTEGIEHGVGHGGLSRRLVTHGQRLL
jgi:hypothetical protein